MKKVCNNTVYSKKYKNFSLCFLLILMIFSFIVGCKEPKVNDDENDKLIRNVLIPDELKECEMSEIANGYKLVWCDEFNVDGKLDNKKWSFEIGTGEGGWGNNESQYYTDREENAYVSDGTLKIIAKKESYKGASYTSSRIVTRGKGDFKYGFMEIRAKLPEGRGVWPAIWMMPTSSVYGGWPNSGEIDIMEAVGSRPNTVLGTLHSASNYGGNGRGKTISCANSATNFNLYQLEWSNDEISFLLNGNKYFTLKNTEQWRNNENGYRFYPYDQEFYFILNVAMGGTLGGAIDPNFISSQMEVDYVRVYEKHDEPDEEVPSIPEFENVFSTSKTIHLEWNEVVDNVKVRYYEIIVNNKQYAATINNEYIIENLNPDTTYKIQLIAVDWQDNYSISSRYSVKTSGLIVVPGEIIATSYSNCANIKVVDGISSESDKILKMAGNGEVSYDILVDKDGTYTFSLRASVLKQVNVNIYLMKDSVKKDLGEIKFNATYGKYEDFNFDLVDLKSGEYKVFIELSNEDINIDSLLLSKIKIYQDKATQ